MKKLSCLGIIKVAIVLSVCAQGTSDRRVGDACEACDLMYEGMPAVIQSETVLTDANEPGETMIITGTMYKKDGRTPAVGVIMYFYHTDKKGVYSPGPNQKDAKRHGHLRGWVKTGADGKYKFRTIRPGSYPDSDNPQHIHPSIKEPGLTLYWIDEFLFDDDPYLTSKVRSDQPKRGGSGIVHLTKDSNGVWTGTRDIILGMNIPNY